jgi:hypothetical protein
MIRKSVGCRLSGANRNSATDFQRDAGCRSKTATHTVVPGECTPKNSSSRSIYREDFGAEGRI